MKLYSMSIRYLLQSISKSVLLFFVLVSSVDAASLGRLAKHASVFSQEKERRAEYELLTGPITYKESNNDSAISGYIPDSAELLHGSINTTLYDFKESISSLYVFEQLMHEYQKQGYQQLFYCIGSQCGEKNGWRVYINETLDGEEGTQHYLATRKVNANGSISYSSAYVIDIDSEPRLAITNVKSSVKIKSAAEIKAAIDSDGSVLFPTLFFSLNSASIKPQALLQLHEMAEYLSSVSVEERFTIVGHADATGTEEYNQKLSEKRADAVRNRLVQQHGVNELVISSLGLGESKPLDKSQAVVKGGSDRRVELIKQPNNLLSRRGE